MQDRLAKFCRALLVDAAMVGLAFCAHHVSAAYWTLLRHVKRFVPARVLFIVDNFRHLRDDVAAALDLNPIADLYPQTLDLIHVMQRGTAHGGAADRNRFESRNRRKLAGTAHLHMNIFDLSDSAARRVLVSDRPSRSFAGKSKLALQRRAVYFDDNPVNFVGQRFAFFFPLADKLPDFVEVLRQRTARVDFESGGIESVQRFPVIAEYRTRGGARASSLKVCGPTGALARRSARNEHVRKKVQSSLCCDAWF